MFEQLDVAGAPLLPLGRLGARVVAVDLTAHLEELVLVLLAGVNQDLDPRKTGTLTLVLE